MPCGHRAACRGKRFAFPPARPFAHKPPQPILIKLSKSTQKERYRQGQDGRMAKRRRNYEYRLMRAIERSHGIHASAPPKVSTRKVCHYARLRRHDARCERIRCVAISPSPMALSRSAGSQNSALHRSDALPYFCIGTRSGMVHVEAARRIHSAPTRPTGGARRIKSGFATVRTHYSAFFTMHEETCTGERLAFNIKALGQSAAG